MIKVKTWKQKSSHHWSMHSSRVFKLASLHSREKKSHLAKYQEIKAWQDAKLFRERNLNLWLSALYLLILTQWQESQLNILLKEKTSKKLKILAYFILQNTSIQLRCIKLLMAGMKEIMVCSSIHVKDVNRHAVVRHLGIKSEIPKRMCNTRLFCRWKR